MYVTLTIIILQIVAIGFFLWQMARSVDTGWATKKTLDAASGERDAIQTAMIQQQQQELARISGWFKASTDEQGAKYVTEKIFRAIDYGIRRHDWYEDQRSRMFQGVVAIVSALLVLVGLLLRVETVPSIGMIVVSFGSAIVGIAALWFVVRDYNAELDRDRPYRMVSDIRFWYFRYNLPTSSKELSGSSLLTASKTILGQRSMYVERLSEIAELVKGTREDIEQLFILQFLQRQKSESLTVMRRRLSWTVIFFAVQILLFVVAYAGASLSHSR